MLLSNFSMLAGLNPAQVNNWFLTAFIDAYEWVMLPNVIGMRLNADGGLTATKPYIASAHYINKMGNYCKGCRFNHKKRHGDDACPFNFLYWNFLLEHEETLCANPRLGKNVLGLRYLDDAGRTAVRQETAVFLKQLFLATKTQALSVKRLATKYLLLDSFCSTRYTSCCSNRYTFALSKESLTMSDQRIQPVNPTFTPSQHALYAIIGITIWVIGVILVRILGPNFFVPGSTLLAVLFVVSIPLGVLTQYVITAIIRQPLEHTMIPVFVMIGTALLCDGIAIAFTNVYSSDTTMKMAVGGWLLWTFGWQCVVTLIIVGRAKNS